MLEKITFSFFISVAIIFFVSTSSFAQCDKTKLTPIQCGYFDQGYQDGIKDAQGKLNNNYKRYKSNFDKKNESYYSQGYQEGFNTITPFVRWEKYQREYYDKGYSNGSDDNRKKISQLPARYEGKYPKDYEPYYVKGYNDGYTGKNREYDSPISSNTTLPTPTITSNPQPRPSPTEKVSNLNGSFYWSGKVDEKLSLVLKGNEVLVSDVFGNGYKESGRKLNGVLPNLPAEITVKKSEGRGDVIVLQQPNKTNEYRAVVQIIDSKSGSDNYRLEIFWTVNLTEESYQRGTLYWSGQVDQTAEIKITGKEVQSIDVAGTGLSFVTANLEGSLSRRTGKVNVFKVRGRGIVTIVQQPDWENDFTAIIRITDTEKGSSDYQLEINW